jgi:RNA recognition motif-containing protein
MVSIGRDNQSERPINAFVRFNRKQDALEAARNHQKITVQGFELECTSYKPSNKIKSNRFTRTTDSKTSEGSSLESCKFRNFPSVFTKRDVQNMLSAYGMIERLIYNQDSGSGSVSYKSKGAVSTAIQDLNGMKFGHKVIQITDTSQVKKEMFQFNNLYIRGIHPDTPEADIKDFFRKYGEISSILRPTKIITVNKEKILVNKSFVYIAFKDPKVASNIIKELDGQHFNNKLKNGRELKLINGKLDIDFYNPKAKFTSKRSSEDKLKAASNTSTQQAQNLIQHFMRAMVFSNQAFPNNARNAIEETKGYGKGKSEDRYYKDVEKQKRTLQTLPPPEFKARAQHNQPKFVTPLPV